MIIKTVRRILLRSKRAEINKKKNQILGKTSISNKRQRNNTNDNHVTTDRQRSLNSQRSYIPTTRIENTVCTHYHNYIGRSKHRTYFEQHFTTSASSPVAAPARRHVRESRVPYELCIMSFTYSD